MDTYEFPRVSEGVMRRSYTSIGNKAKEASIACGALGYEHVLTGVEARGVTQSCSRQIQYKKTCTTEL